MYPLWLLFAVLNIPSLAYVEMRLIFARLLWNFDFELVDKDFTWTKQKAFIVWDKEPLMVKVNQRT